MVYRKGVFVLKLEGHLLWDDHSSFCRQFGQPPAWRVVQRLHVVDTAWLLVTISNLR